MTGVNGNNYLTSLGAGIVVGIFLVAVALTSSLPSSMAYLIIIALAMIIPLSYDIYLSYQNKDKDGKPTGIDGLARTLMAFGIILVLGAAVFQVLTITTNIKPLPTNLSSLDAQLIFLNATSAQNTSQAVEMGKMIEIINKNNEAIIEINKALVEVLKTVLTIFGGAVSAIIGFYFGQRAAESRAGEGKEPPDKPVLNAVTPSEGKIGDEVILTGTNLGSSQNGSVVVFGSINQLKSKEWSATSIKVEVPQDLTPGATTITVVVNGVTSNKKLFTVKSNE